VLRRVASLLLVGVGLLFFVPPLYATILDWRRNGMAYLWPSLPCCVFLALPFFFAAWIVRSGPGFGSHSAWSWWQKTVFVSAAMVYAVVFFVIFAVMFSQLH
jgi:hypothetical protein